MSQESQNPLSTNLPATIPPEQFVVVEVVEPSPPSPPPAPVRRQPRRLLPLLLFVLTCLTTFLTGGLAYSLALMTILVCHEAGHFLQTLRYKIPASFPFFIPFPNLFGTLGAVIAMDPRMQNRRALFDIGASGPILGLIPTLIFCYVGLQWEGQYVDRAIARPGIEFGDPLLLQWMAHSILGPMPENHLIMIGPLAMAGWVGLLITSLNLMPIGQLDGGHILYSLLGRRAKPVASAILFACLFFVIINFRDYYFWSLMLVLLLVFGPGHPPTRRDSVPLGWWRSIVGWCLLSFVIIGFTPNLLQMPSQQPKPERPPSRIVQVERSLDETKLPG